MIAKVTGHQVQIKLSFETNLLAKNWYVSQGGQFDTSAVRQVELQFAQLYSCINLQQVDPIQVFAVQKQRYL